MVKMQMTSQDIANFYLRREGHYKIENGDLYVKVKIRGLLKWLKIKDSYGVKNK